MTEPNRPSGVPRPHVNIHMRCCNVYIYAYVTAARDAYAGFCPRCAMQVRIPIVAEGGSTERMFTTG